MNIYLDGMGGDHAPLAPAMGAVEALEANASLHILLAGLTETLSDALDKALVGKSAALRQRIEIVDCPEVISPEEAPMMAVRTKKQSAFVDGMLRLRDGKTDAFVSAGSTGALLAGGMLRLGRIPGIERPAIGVMLPTGKGHVLLIDSGANVDCQPAYLHQFALMGKAYLEGCHGISDPRIGLLNNGSEEEKGNALTKEVYQRLKADKRLQFAGNIEAREILEGKADVLVCDGFVGNAVLKFMEGMASFLFGRLKESLLGSPRAKIGALLVKPALSGMKKKLDYTEVGGAPLLGVKGCVVKAHGSSNAHAIACAIRQAVQMAEGGVCDKLAELISSEESGRKDNELNGGMTAKHEEAF